MSEAIRERFRFHLDAADQYMADASAKYHDLLNDDDCDQVNALVEEWGTGLHELVDLFAEFQITSNELDDLHRQAREKNRTLEQDRSAFETEKRQELEEIAGKAKVQEQEWKQKLLDVAEKERLLDLAVKLQNESKKKETSVNTSLGSLIQSINDLKLDTKKLEESQKLAAENEKTIDKLGKERELSERNITSLKEDLSASNAVKQSILRSNANLLLKIYESHVKTASFESELESLKNDKLNATSAVQGASEAKRVAEEIAANVQAQLNRLTAEDGPMEMLKKEKSNLQAQLDELNSESGVIKTLEAERNTLQTQLDGINGENGVIKALEAAKTTLQIQLDSINSNNGIIKTLEGERDTLQAQLNVINGDSGVIKTLEGERDTLQTKLDDINGDNGVIKTLEAERDTLQTNLDDINGENGVIKTLAAAKHTLQTQLDDINGENGVIAKLEAEKNQLKSQLEQLTCDPPNSAKRRRLDNSLERVPTGTWHEVLEFSKDIVSELEPLATTNSFYAHLQIMEIFGTSRSPKYIQYTRQPPSSRSDWQCLRTIVEDGSRSAAKMKPDPEVRCKECSKRGRPCTQVKAGDLLSQLRIVGM